MVCFSVTTPSATAGSANTTKPKPRPRPVARSFMTTISTTSPYAWKWSRSFSSVVSHEIPPINSFPWSESISPKASSPLSLSLSLSLSSLCNSRTPGTQPGSRCPRTDLEALHSCASILDSAARIPNPNAPLASFVLNASTTTLAFGRPLCMGTDGDRADEIQGPVYPNISSNSSSSFHFFFFLFIFILFSFLFFSISFSLCFRFLFFHFSFHVFLKIKIKYVKKFTVSSLQNNFFSQKFQTNQ